MVSPPERRRRHVECLVQDEKAMISDEALDFEIESWLL